MKVVVVSPSQFGHIETVSLRDIFKREDQDFIPWLCENVDLLAEELNIELIDVSREEKIGTLCIIVL